MNNLTDENIAANLGFQVVDPNKPVDTPVTEQSSSAAPVVETPAPQATSATADATAVTETIKFGESSTTQNDSTVDLKAIFGIDLPLAEAKKRIEEYEKLQSKLQELENHNPFFDDEVKQYNEAKKNNVPKDVFFSVYGTDPDKMAKTDLLIKGMMLRDGISESSAKLIVEDRYKLNLQEIAINDEMFPEEKADAERQNASIRAQKQLGEALMEADQRGAKEIVLKYKAQAMEVKPAPPKTTPEQVEKALQPVIAKMTDYSKMSVGTFEFNTPKENLDKINKEVYDYLADRDIQVSPDDQKALAAIEQMRRDSFWANNGEKILTAYSVHVAKELLTFKHNPSGLNSNADKQTSSANGEQWESPESMFRKMKEAGM